MTDYPRTPLIDAAHILNHDARRAHHRLCIELCAVCSVMVLSVFMALHDAGWASGLAVNAPLALQSVLTHHYRL